MVIHDTHLNTPTETFTVHRKLQLHYTNHVLYFLQQKLQLNSHKTKVRHTKTYTNLREAQVEIIAGGGTIKYGTNIHHAPLLS